MNTLDVLIAARAEVEKGWAYGWNAEPGRVCAMGAIQVVTGNLPMSTDAYYALSAATSYRSVGDQSDLGRKHALAMYDRAIAAEVAKAVPVSDAAHTFAVA
jgi:hypothetical protein